MARGSPLRSRSERRSPRPAPSAAPQRGAAARGVRARRPASRAVRVSAAGAGPGSSGTTPQKIALAAPGSASSAADRATASRPPSPGGSARRRRARAPRSARPPRNAAPWTNRALPAPAPAGSARGVRNQAHSPSASRQRLSPGSVPPSGQGRLSRHDRLWVRGYRRRDLCALRRAWDPALDRGRAARRAPRSQSVGSIVRNYNLICERVADARRPRGAGPACTRTSEIVDPGFLGEGARPRSPTPRSRSRAAPGRSASAGSPGGRDR